METLAGKKVYVGLSGGVDSAVSAALLKAEGFEVHGVFIKAWSPPKLLAPGGCTWKEDRRSAMRVAAVLDIPFHTLDLEKEYKRDVVDYMIREYKLGRTPNPDVMCNKEIKFGAFLNWAREQGADFVATGHYAELSKDKYGSEVPRESKDSSKDQSYFLWAIKKEDLPQIIFPIGHLQKSEVRKLAEKFGLPQATRKDSQGLCFLGQIDMKEFLKEFADTQEGNVLNLKGEVVGTHDGAILYTLGERHGFRVSNKTTDNKPLYVVRKDINANTITVAHEDEVALATANDKKEFPLTDTNFYTDITKIENLTCRYRYRQEKIPCKVEEVGGFKLLFSEAQPTAASGQSVVFYLPAEEASGGDLCLGGAVLA